MQQQPYAQPGYGQPPAWGGAYGAPQAPPMGAAAPAPGASPMPPDMHWALVLVLSMFTGIFGVIWFWIQSGYVKKIDPTSRARKFFLFGLLAEIVAILASFLIAGAAIGGSATLAMASGFLSFILILVCVVFMIASVFSMRSSLVTYFNTVEPIGLRLSGIMTFFFSILYFQYHLSRIAEWKKTGTLR